MQSALIDIEIGMLNIPLHSYCAYIEYKMNLNFRGKRKKPLNFANELDTIRT